MKGRGERGKEEKVCKGEWEREKMRGGNEAAERQAEGERAEW